MRRTFFALALVAALSLIPATALAGNPHFISVTTTTSGNTLTVVGKEAGLGNESQVHIVVTATAQCVNPGGQAPSAANKQTFSAAGDFPVQNGKAEFSLSLTAVLSPDCTPPMTIVWSNVTVTDTTSGITYP